MNGKLQMTVVAAALVLFIGGCVDAEQTDHTNKQSSAAMCSAWGGSYSGVSFTDEQAVHTVDMADNATAAELESLSGVGPVIAARIIAGRPYGEQPDPLAALDALAQVGPATLKKLRDQSFHRWCAVDDGRQSCCFSLTCEAGSASGVAFTADQAHTVLSWANYATRDELTRVCGVGSTIATNIEAARPIHNLAELDAISYVGPTLLHRLLGDPGYECNVMGADGRSVTYNWCTTHECTCDASSQLNCTVPIEYENISEMTDEPALQSFVAGLIALGNPCAPDNTNPVVSTIIEVCLVGTSNYVELVQEQTDPGAQATEGPHHIYYYFDENLNVSSSTCEGPTTTPQTTVEEWVCEQDLDCVGNRSAELRTVVEDLVANAPKCDENVYFPVEYAYLDITTVDGTPTQYVVNLVQMLDPEGGVQCWIEYTYDASFDLIDGPIYEV